MLHHVRRSFQSIDFDDSPENDPNDESSPPPIQSTVLRTQSAANNTPFPQSQSDLVNNEQDQDTNEAADTQLKRTNSKHEWTHCISYFGSCCAYTTYNQYHRR
eukprot:246392_1